MSSPSPTGSDSESGRRLRRTDWSEADGAGRRNRRTEVDAGRARFGAGLMADESRRATLPVNLDHAWSVLADFAAIVRWAPNVDHSSILTAQVDGVGAARRIQAGRTVLVERVVEWDPPTAIAYEVEGLPPVVKSARNRWVLEPQGDRFTLATLTSTVHVGSRPPQQAIARLIAKRLAKASDEMLAGLATHLTASEPTS